MRLLGALPTKLFFVTKNFVIKYEKHSCRLPFVGDGPDTVSESTTSDTGLSEFLPSTSSRERTRQVPLSLLCVCAKVNSASGFQNQPSLPKTQ